MRNHTLPPHILNPLLFDQPAEGMKGASRFESAYSLLILAFEEDTELGICGAIRRYVCGLAVVSLGLRC